MKTNTIKLILILLTPFIFVNCGKSENQNSLKVVESEVEFMNGGVKLSGTLSIPETGAPCPAIIMITGSGPQTRDEDVFGFKVFKTLSEYLIKNGIAVLRYDDRGVGKSTGNSEKSTMYDFAADAQAGIELLRKEPKIDKNQIGIFGHSEGGMIAPYIASRDSGIAFIILMSGPAITGDSIVNYQVIASNKQAGLSQELINEAIILQNKIYDEIKKPFLSQKWDSVEAEFIAFTVKSLKALPEDKRQGITDFEQFAKYQMQAQLKAVKTPWFKEFISYKPIETLKKVKCPVLALFGELDFQVPAKPNIEALQKYIEQTGTKNIDMKTFPKANHLFQESVTGMMDEYAILKKEFVPVFSDYIVEWIKKR